MVPELLEPPGPGLAVVELPPAAPLEPVPDEPELPEVEGVLPLAPMVPVLLLLELLPGVLEDPLAAVSELLLPLVDGVVALLPLVDGVVALPLAPIVEREELESVAVGVLLFASAPAVVSFAPRLQPARPSAQAATMAAAVLRVTRDVVMSVLLGCLREEGWMERRRNGSPCCLGPTLGSWCERAVVSHCTWV